MIGSLRSLGLILKEIQEISAIYVEHRGELIGPYLREKLDRALDRTDTRIAELQDIRHRVRGFRAAHAVALAGRAHLELYALDPLGQLLRVAS